MSKPGKLTLEQEFKLQMLEGQVKSLDLDQAQGYILELLRQMMVKDNIMKGLLRAEL
ncbi:MAG: phycobilisome degradation protein NblA [Cyanothece sp. SIO2G6]|nr:phycobilisome degradation protein NblA [Cyanothece sp. SIO2G6]